MTEATVQEKETREQVPVIGPGSPRGWRWFASCRYPTMTVTIRPAEDKTATQRAVKGQYVILKTSAKPNIFQGDGELGTDNHSGTDQNDSPYWGIYKTFDPGPEPEDGYTDDGKDVPRAERLTRERKKELRAEVDALRSNPQYKHTRQDNELDRLMQLKETNWDPTEYSGNIRGYVARGKQTIGKEGVRQPQVAAPQETRVETPKPRVPSLGKPRS